MTIKLNRNEKVLAVVPEYCSGPGWTNKLVHVHILDYSNNTYRVVYLQPNEITPTMDTLFGIGATVCKKLIDAVNIKESKK